MNVALDMGRAKVALLEKLDAVTHAPRAPETYRRLEQSVNVEDALSWLAAQTVCPRFYWRDRDGAFESAGFGCAHALAATGGPHALRIVEELSRQLEWAPAETRYFGGLSFDSDGQASEEWRDFEAGSLVLPSVELTRSSGAWRLTCNIFVESGSDAQAAFSRARADIEATKKPEPHATWRIPSLRSEEHCPERQAWLDIIADALAKIAAGEFRKVVLARQTAFKFAELASPVTLLKALGAGNDFAYRYLFQPNAKAAFVGVSPERLYRRRARRIESEALAGTRPRGMDEESDARLAAELLASRKDGIEQSLVTGFIRGALERICSVVEKAPAPQVARFRDCQHLLTPISGALRDGLTDADVLRELHPTPALGGEPTAKAVDFIRAAEPFARGWYGGPVGWVAPGAAEFAVAIRSGLLLRDSLLWYAGAGVVADSNPEEEWDELDLKTRLLEGVLCRDAD